MVPWSDLHADLLRKIVHGLHSAVDVIRVRSVCRSWRDSLPATAVDPCEHPRKSPALIQKSIWSLQSTQPKSTGKSTGCLILFNVAKNGRRSIGNPILQENELVLQVSSDPCILNFLHLRVNERDRFYILCEVKTVEGRIRTQRYCYSKALVFPSSIWSKPNDLAFLAVPISGESGDLRLRKYGEKSWTVIEGSGNFQFQDIAIFEDQFVAVDARGAVFSINLATRQAEEFGPPQTECTVPDSERRLVVHGVDLYLVKTEKTWDDFEVRKLGYKQGSKCWVEVNNLGSRALFWGQFSSFFIEAQECRDCRANCIYYHDRSRNTIREFDLQWKRASRWVNFLAPSSKRAPKDVVFSNIIPWELVQSSEVMKFSIGAYKSTDVYNRTEFGDTGLGGLLRDSDGRIRAMFSGKLDSVIKAKSEVGKLLQIIHFAMKVFYKAGWPGKKKLHLEVSCSNTFGLIFPLLPLICPPEDYYTRLIGEVGYSCVEHNEAVEIAKKGIDRPSFFQGWD